MFCSKLDRRGREATVICLYPIFILAFPPTFARAAKWNVGKARQCNLLSLLPMFTSNGLCVPINMMYVGFTVDIDHFRVRGDLSTVSKLRMTHMNL